MARDELAKPIKDEIEKLKILRSICLDECFVFDYSTSSCNKQLFPKKGPKLKDEIAQLKRILAEYQASIDEPEISSRKKRRGKS